MSSTALITGASSGLGAEFASQLAARGHDVVLVARSGDRLEAEARRIRAEHGVKAEVIVQDLVEPDAAQRIKIELDARGLQVGLLVNNAGFGTCGRFEEISGARDHDQLMVNVVALVDLSHKLLPGMLANGGGAVVNIASTAAFQPSPYFAVYSAAKTFVLNFSLALRNEYRGRGVKVLAVCPGPVPTGFVEAIGNEKAASFGALLPADRVVRTALRALDRDRAYVTPGLGNALNAHLMPRRPRALVAAISERVNRTVFDGGAKDGASAGAGAATAAVAP
jgi:uncharacterized protein